MKGYVSLLAVLFLCSPLFAQTKTTPEEDAVLTVQRQWLAASQRGDDAVLQQIIDERFVGSTPNDHVIVRSELFPPSGSPPAFTTTHFEDLNASVIANTAIVFGKMVTAGDHTRTLRCAMFYLKREGTWKMIAAHLVPISSNDEASGD